MVRRTTRGERTQGRLLDAARAVMAERGYAAARVEDVVAAAGVSHGTFYTYFDNKAAALDALIDTAAAELQAVVDEPWDAASVEVVIGRFVQVFASHGDVVRIWLEASAHDGHFARRLTMVRAGYVARVAAVLAPTLRASGHDASLAAAALVAMVEGAVTQAVGDGHGDATEDLVRTLRSLWIGGVVRLAEGR